MTTTITRDLLRTLRIDIDAALGEVGKKHGLLISLGNVRFTPDSATGRLSIVPTSDVPQNQGSAIGQAVTGDSATIREQIAAKDYLSHWVLYNLNPDWLGKQFNMNGSQFTLVGLQPNRSKNCCLIKRVSTGKNFVASPEAIRRAFAG